MPDPSNRSRTLALLILFQTVCLVFFMGDVIEDIRDLGWSSLTSTHLMPELGATIGMAIGLIFEARYLLRMLRRQAHMERSLSVAAGELARLIEDYFQQWGLTPSEQDIASFTIKGYSIAEIAGFRGSAEATVKTHLNAIYRKAGVTGRAQLVSLLVEDLLRSALIGPEAGQGGAPRREIAAGAD